MRRLLQFLMLLFLVFTPFTIGCSSRLSEEDAAAKEEAGQGEDVFPEDADPGTE